MKSKILGLMCLSILVLVLAMGFGSAAVTFSNVPTLSQTGTSFDIDVTSDVIELVDFTATQIIDSTTGKTITFNPTNFSFLTTGTVETVSIYYTVDLGFEFEFGKTYTTTLTAIGAVSTNSTDIPLSFEQSDFCEYDEGVCENPGELKVDIKDITVISGFGDDEEWVPLDKIEVEIEVENKGDFDVDDISVEWGLYNVVNDEWAIEMDDVEDEFNLKDRDEEKLTITFRVDDDDFDLNLDEFGDSYTLFVRATGEVDNDTNPKTCASDSKDISIEIESDFVILNNFQIEGIELDDMSYPDTVECGSTLHLTANIWNIGERNQEDIEIRVYNKDLGIDETLEIGDLDSFDDETISFEFTIPEGIEEKWYELEFTIYEDNDIFENDYDDDEAVFNVLLDVEGNCAVAEVILSAGVESGGKSGRELVIKATVTNPGSELNTYVLMITGYDSWASLVDIEPSTLILDAGKSAEVFITFKIDKDASGDQQFNIEVLSEGELIIIQPVGPVSIEKALLGSNDLLTALIVAISIILIIIIIVLAVKVARK